ncbi:c-type cytochrome biogenesis protein CcmI [Lentibacter algarum]|nr:c-type cytochrome biogenesis protein CcmI [Lentibacter algarum]
MIFWMIALALACLAATLFALALFRSDASEEHPAAYDLRVYRDQLNDVERDLARGVISEADAERTRTEVGRRVLKADAQLAKAAKTGDQPQTLTRAMAAFTSLAVVAGSLGLYAQLGAPSQPDQPHKARLSAAQTLYETRPSQAAYTAKLPPQPKPQADAGFEELIAKLREAVAQNPGELQGQQFLATNEARLGNFTAAQKAQSAVIALKADEATAADNTALAQMMITQASGYVSPEAEAALRAALVIDEKHPVARYFLGQMWAQNDRADRAFALWSRLLTEGPEAAPWIAPIRANIDDIAWLAGVDYTQPKAETLAGPSAEDIESAAEMSAQDRDEMIRGMVSRLSDRLATEGGSPEEWARLIGALGTLGESDRAKAIWQEAQSRFADNPAALATVRTGAKRAGLVQ